MNQFLVNHFLAGVFPFFEIYKLKCKNKFQLFYKRKQNKIFHFFSKIRSTSLKQN